MKKMLTYVRRNKRVIKFGHKKPRTLSLTKPRIDLSVFLSPPSMSNLPHLRKKSYPVKEDLTTLATATPHETSDMEEDVLHLPLAQWTCFQNKKKAVAKDTPCLTVGSLSKRVPMKPQDKSNIDAQKPGTSALEFAYEKSTNSMCSDVCLLGRAVWAKRDPQMWWPAKIMVRASAEPNFGTEVTKGPVLVHYYGTEERRWVDPARDLSPFEECFEQRSWNPSKEFQEALKQAIFSKN